MKNLIEELRNDERGPQDTLVDNNPHYKELQPLQFSNETELLESLSEEQKEKLEKYCDITLEMSPYPNAKHLPRDSESPCGWRAPRLRTKQMNNAIQPLDLKRIKGLFLSLEGGDCHVQLKQTGIYKFRKKGKSHELF